MTYQVLARKWRPHSFRDLVGQEHVLQALVHALEQQRLHHAYLFTGTRGVGKTTIGRILARCLNCEEGISPEPCGVCTSCTEVLEGRFVDLIEIDAASRTKVEDMRELLDNVQYSPTRGRFKIYLIDEVHMLSNSSFNALLKTLEEPPAHVKFLFATTDPQKLPVTILSRCLQFNLKRMSPERIVSHLRHILEVEAIPAEDAALWQLARSADGSMRDALSLTDQAIAYGNQRLEAEGISTMLGTINQQDVYQLIEAIVANDTPAVLAEVAHMAEFSPDYRSVLAELLATFHRIALEQAVPGSADNAEGDAEQVSALAGRLSAEDVQLFYQTALMSRKDLEVTPDARMGFEMALLRMLAFRPGAGTAKALARPSASSGARRESQTPVAARATEDDKGSADSKLPANSEASANNSASAARPAQARPSGPPRTEGNAGISASGPTPGEPTPGKQTTPDHNKKQRDSAASEDRPGPEVPSQQTPNTSAEDRPPWEDEAIPVEAYSDQAQAEDFSETPPVDRQPRSQPDTRPGNRPDPEATERSGQSPGRSQTSPSDREEGSPPKPEPAQLSSPAEPEPANEPAFTKAFDWTRDFDQLPINGMPKTLASNAALSLDNDVATLTLAEGHLRLLSDRHRERLLEALKTVYPQLRRLDLAAGEAGDAAPAVRAAQVRAARQASAVEAIHQDPHVRELVARFNGEVIEDSIKPV